MGRRSNEVDSSGSKEYWLGKVGADNPTIPSGLGGSSHAPHPKFRRPTGVKVGGGQVFGVSHRGISRVCMGQSNNNWLQLFVAPEKAANERARSLVDWALLSQHVPVMMVVSLSLSRAQNQKHGPTGPGPGAGEGAG